MGATKLCFKIRRAKNRLIRDFWRRLLRLLYSCDFSPGCEIGEGFSLAHNGLGCVIWAKEIGRDTTIWQNVTLGSGKGIYPDVFPVIGRNVKIYTGAVVLGNITVGDGAVIGANAVVIHDVPPNAVVGGVPARVIRIEEKDPF